MLFSGFTATTFFVAGFIISTRVQIGKFLVTIPSFILPYIFLLCNKIVNFHRNIVNNYEYKVSRGLTFSKMHLCLSSCKHLFADIHRKTPTPGHVIRAWVIFWN